MLDINKLVRYGVGQSLTGQLIYESVSVPVVDDVLTSDTNSDMYVLLGSQTAVEQSNFAKFAHDCTITLDIAHNTGFGVSKDGVDNVAQQIFTILQPTTITNGLTAQAGIQFSDLQKDSDSYLTMTLSDGSAVVRRIIVYRVLVHQN